MAEASGSGTAAQEGVETEEDHREYPALIRATDGKSKKCKVKISTLVSPLPWCEACNALRSSSDLV